MYKIRVDYFTGTLKIHKLTFYKSDELHVFVSIKKLLVNFNYWPFLRKEFVVSEISLEKFYSQIEQKGTLFNISKLISKKDSLSHKKPKLVW